MSRQTTMAGVIPPLTLPQERAHDYLAALIVSAKAQEKAKDALDDMIAAAIKAKVDTIKIRDDKNRLVVFQIDNKITVKRSMLTEMKIEKDEKKAASAAGAAGPAK